MMSNKALLKVTKREEILKQYKKFMRRKVFFTHLINLFPHRYFRKYTELLNNCYFKKTKGDVGAAELPMDSQM